VAGRKNLYQGPSSCYARNEGVWVPGSGVTPETLPSFIALIIRDMYRGMVYDEETCEPRKVDPSYLIGRLQYLIALAKKHGGEEAKIYTEEALERLYREYRLPPGVTKIKLAGYRGKLDEVAKEIEDLLGVKVEKEYHEEPAAVASAKTRRSRKAVAVAR
jgi:FMN phosphatase YigB (HAD superfamily)